MTEQIYELISKISKEAGSLAPSKSGGVPFPFRGIDATINHISPLLQKYGVITVPEVLEVDHSAREVGTKVVTQTSLRTRYTFYAPDGSNVAVVTAGLAHDFADRSAAQAQSVAFRVAILQLFTLPTDSKEPEANGEEILKGVADEQAKIAATKATVKATGPSVSDLQGEIRQLIEGTYANKAGVVADAVPAAKIDALGEKISGKSGPSWKRDRDVLAKVLTELVPA